MTNFHAYQTIVKKYIAFILCTLYNTDIGMLKLQYRFYNCIYLLGYGTLENVIPMITLVIIGCPPRG